MKVRSRRVSRKTMRRKASRKHSRRHRMKGRKQHGGATHEILLRIEPTGAANANTITRVRIPNSLLSDSNKAAVPATFKEFTTADGTIVSSMSNQTLTLVKNALNINEYGLIDDLPGSGTVKFLTPTEVKYYRYRPARNRTITSPAITAGWYEVTTPRTGAAGQVLNTKDNNSTLRFYQLSAANLGLDNTTGNESTTNPYNVKIVLALS